MENTGGNDVIKRIAYIRTDFPEKFGMEKIPFFRGLKSTGASRKNSF